MSEHVAEVEEVAGDLFTEWQAELEDGDAGLRRQSEEAIASLKNELATVETNVAALIKDMEAAVAEANQFIGAMKPPEA